MSNLILALDKEEVNRKEENDMYFVDNCGKNHIVRVGVDSSVTVTRAKCNKKQYCRICRAEYAVELKNRIMRANDSVGVDVIALPAHEMRPIFTVLRKKHKLSFDYLKIPLANGNVLLFVPQGLDGGHGTRLVTDDINAFRWTRLANNPKGTRIMGSLGKLEKVVEMLGATVELTEHIMGVSGLKKDAMVEIYSNAIRGFESINLSKSEWKDSIVPYFDTRLSILAVGVSKKMNTTFTNQKSVPTNKLVWTPKLNWMDDKPIEFESDSFNYMNVDTIEF